MKLALLFSMIALSLGMAKPALADEGSILRIRAEYDVSPLDFQIYNASDIDTFFVEQGPSRIGN